MTVWTGGEISTDYFWWWSWFTNSTSSHHLLTHMQVCQCKAQNNLHAGAWTWMTSPRLEHVASEHKQHSHYLPKWLKSNFSPPEWKSNLFMDVWRNQIRPGPLPYVVLDPIRIRSLTMWPMSEQLDRNFCILFNVFLVCTYRLSPFSVSLSQTS